MSSWSAQLAAILLLLAFTTSKALASVTASISTKVLPPSPVTGPSTCPSRSLNYITQTLPQQCLTTSWASKPTSQEKATENGVPSSSDSRDQISNIQSATVAATVTSANARLETADTSPTFIDTSRITTTSAESSSFSPIVYPVKALPYLPEQEQQTEPDSPLDNANFLSFEEWKKQNLAKAGQSAENLGVRAGGDEPRRRPGSINNALDSLGEDTEIEIDFRGFVSSDTSQPEGPLARHGGVDVSSGERNVVGEREIASEETGVRMKGKDAGKTCKERSNYASFDCAATMLKTNAESEGSNSVLVENRDSYMLNICSAKNKFFIVELCDDILIDTVVLANFEFFSSMFRTFKISVSDRYPVKSDNWRDLGTHEAKNSREVQAFLIENPLIWARYLRIEFLTHFGNEYYCPVSLLRVHGTTMMEEFNHDLKRTSAEEDNDNGVGENDEGESIDSLPGVVSAGASEDPIHETFKRSTGTATWSSDPPVTSFIDPLSDSKVNTTTTTIALLPEPLSFNDFAPYNFSISRRMEDFISGNSEPDESCGREDTPADSTSGLSVSVSTPQSAAYAQLANTIDPVVTQVSEQTDDTVPTEVSTPAEVLSSETPTAPNKGPSQHGAEPIRSLNQTSTIATKIQTSTQAHNPNPTTQESFFKSVHKRLQLLEANSTLSLQYIEEQSRILRDAFSKVEKRQLAKSTNFLETLNNTVLTELREFRAQYDQIWQSTVLELSSQREQSQHEVFALSTRLSLLADEIVFQKRMAIIQFLLILLSLGLAIFSRSSSSATHLELPPLVQNAINKSSINLSRYTPQFESPPVSPSSTRPCSRYGLFRGLAHRRGLSEESQPGRTHDGVKSPSIEYSPPTPTSQGSPGSHGGGATGTDREEDSSDSFSHVEGSAARRIKSSPATPSGQREGYRDFDNGLLRQLNNDLEG